MKTSSYVGVHLAFVCRVIRKILFEVAIKLRLHYMLQENVFILSFMYCVLPYPIRRCPDYFYPGVFY